MMTASVRRRRKRHLKTVQCAQDGNQDPSLNLDLVEQGNIGVDRVVMCHAHRHRPSHRALARPPSLLLNEEALWTQMLAFPPGT